MDHAPSTTSRPPRERMRRGTLWVLVLLGSALIATRGAWRATQPEGNRDFRLLYSCAKAWMAGANPYEDTQVRAVFDREAGDPGVDAIGAERTSNQLVYPPATFPLIAPLTALPWRLASPIWIVLNLALYPASIAMIARALRLRGTARLALWAGGLMLGPAQTALKYGQPSIVVLACIAGAWVARSRAMERPDNSASIRPTNKSSILAGVLLALATALKPSMGLLFLLYEIGRLRWRLALAALITLALAYAIGIGQLAAHHIDWFPALQRNLANFTTISDGAPLATNDSRHHMLNLHYPLGTLVHDPALVKPLVVALLAAISLAYFLFDLRRGGAKGERRAWPGETLSAAMCAAITLSIVYHRFYDGVLMLFVVALAVLWWSRPVMPSARLLVTLIVAGFCIQWSIPLAAIAGKNALPQSITRGPFWIGVALPAQAWLLPVLALLFVALRARSASAAPDQRAGA